MKRQKCKVCGAEIGTYGWNKHVEKHKRAYCRAIGRTETEWWRVNWEYVVLFFNPGAANESKCVKSHEEHAKLRLDRRLADYI